MKVRILNAYIAKVLRAAETENVVSLAFHRAINLTNGPEKLFAPGVLRRVLFPRRPPAAAPRGTASGQGRRIRPPIAGSLMLLRPFST